YRRFAAGSLEFPLSEEEKASVGRNPPSRGARAAARGRRKRDLQRVIVDRDPPTRGTANEQRMCARAIVRRNLKRRADVEVHDLRLGSITRERDDARADVVAVVLPDALARLGP